MNIIRREEPLPRHSYEGAGGWKDGRLGQAYDLVWAALTERGDEATRQAVCNLIEELDNQAKGQRT